MSLKHRLLMQLGGVPILYVLSTNKKNTTIFHMTIVIVTVVKNAVF